MLYINRPSGSAITTHGATLEVLNEDAVVVARVIVAVTHEVDVTVERVEDDPRVTFQVP